MTTHSDQGIRFCIRLPQTYCTAGPQAILDVAQAADEFGLYGVSVQDHIIADAALSSCAGLHDQSGEDRSDDEAHQYMANGFGSRFNEEGLQTLVISGGLDTFIEKTRRFVDAGVNVFDLKFVPITIDKTIEQMEVLVRDVLPALES